jgi:subtilase family serine protease
MFRKFKSAALLGAISAVIPALFLCVRASAANPAPQSRDAITQEIDESKRVVLRGNTRPEANRRNDRGYVRDDFRLDHMLLQLKRSPEQEQALEQYIDGLTDRNSPNAHQWLTATQMGDTYGLSDNDIEKITSWLESYGITVNLVYPNRMVMDISGTAAQLRRAFQVEIHYLDVNGERHFANLNDPQIPAAFASVITGIVSMHNFKPRTTVRPRTNYTFESDSTTEYGLVPADLETIYNLNPLFSEGISGQGQTIVVLEDTNVYTTADWTTFRSTFGLSKYTSGTFTQLHPPSTPVNNCMNPGTNADDGEAILDAEYASAAAPNAAIELASCADSATFGGLIALQNLINGSSPPAIMSMSYLECEASNGATANAAFNDAYQQAAVEGVSVFVAAGDGGPATCDDDAASATHGIGVNGYASTPYNVAVGGTDFSDTYNNANGTYWNSTNSAIDGSAKSYIPEIPWNDSCASVVLATYQGNSTTYGSSGFCNSTVGKTFLSTGAGGGGPSGCATGSASTSEVVSGTCAGYAKPSWQAGLYGNPSDGVRDLPDVSLFAANGIWSHYYIFCYSDPHHGRGGALCTEAPSGWSGAGGTSFASPIMAGIQALINQKSATRQGNPNPTYYAIAATEYGSNGSSNCNSTTQPILPRGISTTCVFYDVTQGDIDLNCTGSDNCYIPSGANGVLNTGAVTSVALGAPGSGYPSGTTCTIAAPDNSSAYGGYTGGIQATCSATVSGGQVTSVTLVTAGAGYITNPICTLSGTGGSGATCAATSTVGAATGYEPAFPATDGWDFATGIGTVNAYNLVYSPNW